MILVMNYYIKHCKSYDSHDLIYTVTHKWYLSAHTHIETIRQLQEPNNKHYMKLNCQIKTEQVVCR